MPTKYTAAEAKKLIALSKLDRLAPIVQKYLDGDTWQGGEQFLGPLPNPAEPGAGDAKKLIERSQVAADMINEVLDRHVLAIVGNDPVWSLTVKRALAEDEKPNEAEQKLIDEAEALLTTWWDKAEIRKMLQEALKIALVKNRCTPRLYIPRGLVVSDDTNDESIDPALVGTVQLTDWLKAEDCVHVDPLPDPSAACVTPDPNSRLPVGVFVAGSGKSEQVEIAEIDYLTGQTRLTIFGKDAQGKAETTEALYSWGGNLPMHNIEAKPLITKSTLSLQKLINLGLTMAGRNMVTAGFVARMLMNVEVPGHEDEQGNWVTDAINVGPTATTVLHGTPIEDEEGNIKGYATPQVHESEPVQVTSFSDTVNLGYVMLLSQVHQLYAAMAKDATASGESRIQARYDFVMNLGGSAAVMAKATRWLLETAMAMMAELQSNAGAYDTLRAVAKCRIDAGPLSPDEMRVVAELFTAGLLDHESALEWLAVEDVDAILARVAAAKEEKKQTSQQQLEVALGRSRDIADQIRGQTQPTNPPAGQQQGDPQSQGGTGQNGQ